MAGRYRRPGQQAKQAEAGSARAREPFSKRDLENAALAYVNRFDCTASKLTRHLTERARKAGGDAAEVQLWIRELIERYLGSGVLNDTRFATNLASQLGARGKSTRAISQKLSARGVTADVTQQLLAERRQNEPGAELEAARAYARKRRLGAFRSAEKRAEWRQKDLASLARQGFSFDIARQALGSTQSGEDDEF